MQPFAGQPAAQAGLKSGDIILKVDAKATENLTVFEVVTLIRGPRGSTVHLTIKREGVEEPLDVPVVRDRVDIPVVESRMLDQGIAYLRLTDFNNLATQKVKAALTDLLQQKPHGLIFDLRSNPGGFLHVAVEIGSQFVAKGNIVTEKSKDGAEEAFPVQPGGLVTDPALPVVVLVNAGTASASEIVAAAIRDTGRGILIGERTFGKSSVQIPHDLSDGSELRVTIAKWFTPKGDQITGGLTPDIEVKLTTEDMTAKRDPQLDRAVEYLVNGK